MVGIPLFVTAKPMISTLATNAILVAGSMLFLWSISLIRRDVSIVDIFWGTGFVLISWCTWLRLPVDDRSLVLPALTTGWGLRLSLHLLMRNWGKPEDSRYSEMRKKHGDRFPLVSLLTVFVLQGVVMWVVALPIQGIRSPSSWSSPVMVSGITVWLIGFLFEAIGDWQLVKFKQIPANRGRVLETGLWKYTRHPNYFGDCCVWWGLFLVAFAQQSPIWTVVGPIVMSITLLRFSGVSLLEKTLVKAKPEYVDYVRRTSAFIPLPPTNSGK